MIEIVKAKLTVIKKADQPKLGRLILDRIGQSLRHYFADNEPVPEAITKLMDRLAHNDQTRTNPPK